MHQWYDAPLCDFTTQKRALEYTMPENQSEYTFSIFPKEFHEGYHMVRINLGGVWTSFSTSSRICTTSFMLWALLPTFCLLYLLV